MIIHVKQSFELQDKSGEKWGARNGDIVVPPEWVSRNDYFRAFVTAVKSPFMSIQRR